MGIYQAPLPGGGSQPFTIKGDAPSETEQGRIDAWIKTNIPDLTPPKQEEEQGFWGSAKHSFLDTAHTAYMSPTIARAALGNADAVRELDADTKARQEEDAKGPQAISWEDAKSQGIAGLSRFAREGAGSLVGAAALPIAAAGVGAGAIAAAPIEGAAALGFGALSGAAFALQGFAEGTKGGIESQRAAGIAPEDVSGGKAALVGAGIGALGAVPPMKFLTPIVKGVGMKVAQELTAEGLEKMAQRGALNSGARAAVSEAAQMGAYNAGLGVAQVAGNRWQSGQDLTSPEALGQMRDAAAYGAFQ